MEKLKIKHDHTLTDILKVGIFAIILLIPILIWLPSILFFAHNDNANAPTTEITIEENIIAETNKVNTYHDLIIGNAYVFDLSNGFTLDTNYTYEVEECYIISGTNTNTQELPSLTNVPYLRFYTNNQVAIVTQQVNANTDRFVYYTNAKIAFICSQNINIGGLINYVKPYYEYNLGINTYTINAVEITPQIEYNWKTIWKTPFLQWTDNNNFQFTINAFTNVFGITQESHITNYINYILTMTCIYLVFDIVISISTKITHMITNSKN